MDINTSGKLKKLIICALCATSVSFAGSLYAKPDHAGGNSGSGGGKPEQPGSGKGGLYSDLVVLHRDQLGAPILATVPGNGEGESVKCLQPISYAVIDGVESITNPADGKTVWPIPLGGTGAEGEECDVAPDYAAYPMEVLFGRLNMGRSPTRVLAQQLRDITASLASSTDPLRIDEVGRLVYFVDQVGFEVDSPGHNLAIHQELQEQGYLQDQTQSMIVLPPQANPDDQTGFLDHAAAALGAAAGKGDLINLDLVVYDNRILNIPRDTEALATSTVNGERYIDYDAEGYYYSRSTLYPGCVRGQLVNFPVVGQSRLFGGRIMDCVFGDITANPDGTSATCSDGDDFTGQTGVHSFAQRADDARAVIAFVHDNVVNDSTAMLPETIAGIDQAGQKLIADANNDQCPSP